MKSTNPNYNAFAYGNTGVNPKVKRKERAAERIEFRANLSATTQLKRLNTRLGDGVGAAKERARLQSLISGAEKSPAMQERKATQELNRIMPNQGASPATLIARGAFITSKSPASLKTKGQ